MITINFMGEKHVLTSAQENLDLTLSLYINHKYDQLTERLQHYEPIELRDLALYMNNLGYNFCDYITLINYKFN